MNTLVLGLGNTLLGDEGVGVHIVQQMQQDNAGIDNITYLDGGTLSFTLAGYIEEAGNLIIIDAAQLNSSPGVIKVYEDEAMDQFVTGNRNKSVHEVNITDILSLAHLTGHLPERRALIGIQPQLIDWGDTLSESVAQAIPQVFKITRDLILRWEQEKEVIA
ncbi:MAG: HyaD/HybD family hydrogenase maturation endopeptidase [Methylococcaceae bacterium]